MNRNAHFGRRLLWALGLSALTVAGCTSPIKHDFDPFAHAATFDVPRELQKATLPAYRVEPPDVLLIEVAHNIRSPFEPIKAGDDLTIRADLPGENATQSAQNTANLGVIGLTDYHLINGFYRVQADGSIDLGPIYGSVKIAGMLPDGARQLLANHLRTTSGIADVKASVSYPEVGGRQVIAGEHLVRPDGEISLGIYGNIRVAGMTLDQVTDVVTAHLRHYLNDPDVRVDVLGLQQQSLLRRHRWWRKRRTRRPHSVHRQRDGARRRGTDSGSLGYFVEAALGRPTFAAGLCRFASHDGRLARHHPGRSDCNELSNPSGRPDLHQGRRSGALDNWLVQSRRRSNACWAASCWEPVLTTVS